MIADFVFGRLLPGVVAILAGGLLALFGFALYDGLTADSFSLRKDAWTCTASHREVHTSAMPVGKIVIPTVSTSTVCDQWSRR